VVVYTNGNGWQVGLASSKGNDERPTGKSRTQGYSTGGNTKMPGTLGRIDCMDILHGKTHLYVVEVKGETALELGAEVTISPADEDQGENWDEVGKILLEATHLNGDEFYFSVWLSYGSDKPWVAGLPDSFTEPLAIGNTPLEAAQNLLLEVKKRHDVTVDPVGEHWSEVSCREWLDERGNVFEGHPAYLKVPFWVALDEKDNPGTRHIGRGYSRIEALRNCVIAVSCGLKDVTPEELPETEEV
jgi:hypothetical protein